MHLQEIDSTQKYLINRINQGLRDQVIISTQKQSAGFGRNDRQWEQFPGSIAFSFILSPSLPATLTPLEVGIHLCQFANHHLKLKWPNDLLTPKGKKCGGILCNYIDSQTIVVGVGLNWGGLPQEKYGQITKTTTLSAPDYQEIPIKMFHYIQDNRLEQKEIIARWISLCAHMNQTVRIEDQKGVFTGIGNNGEAILDGERKFLSGSLFMNQYSD